MLISSNAQKVAIYNTDFFAYFKDSFVRFQAFLTQISFIP
jgi:hypothetical protein